MKFLTSSAKKCTISFEVEELNSVSSESVQKIKWLLGNLTLDRLRTRQVQDEDSGWNDFSSRYDNRHNATDPLKFAIK